MRRCEIHLCARSIAFRAVRARAEVARRRSQKRLKVTDSASQTAEQHKLLRRRCGRRAAGSGTPPANQRRQRHPFSKIRGNLQSNAALWICFTTKYISRTFPQHWESNLRKYPYVRKRPPPPPALVLKFRCPETGFLFASALHSPTFLFLSAGEGSCLVLPLGRCCACSGQLGGLP